MMNAALRQQPEDQNRYQHLWGLSDLLVPHKPNKAQFRDLAFSDRYVTIQHDRCPKVK